MITLPDLFSSYLKIQGVSSVSIRNYRCDLKHFLGWLVLTLKGHNLPTFENEEVKLIGYYFNERYVGAYKEFLVSNRLPASTINRRLSTLRSFANYCLTQGYIAINPLINLGNVELASLEEKLPNEDLLSLFQQSLTLEAISSNTIKNYLSDIREYLTFIQVGSNSNSNFFNRINANSFSSFKYFLATKGASESSIKRVESSLRKFCAWGVKERYLLKNPFEKKLSFSFPFTIKHLPLTIKSYRALPYFTYLNFLILVIFLGALGFGLYQQFIVKAPQNLAFPNAPVAPKRYLSFQGRLTDTSGNPLENAITFQFQIYDAPSAAVPPTGGNLLWNSGNCTIDPDQDGIFRLGLRSGNCLLCFYGKLSSLAPG
jgi:site-specific recombinase XerD